MLLTVSKDTTVPISRHSNVEIIALTIIPVRKSRQFVFERNVRRIYYLRSSAASLLRLLQSQTPIKLKKQTLSKKL